jgi:bacteriocin biosynthesis cyclodehydratase domain-containing protein
MQTPIMQTPIEIHAVGAFGSAVLRYLQALCADRIEAVSEDVVASAGHTAGNRIQVLAAWRPVPDLCEALNRSAFEFDCPFIPLIADSHTLSLGPVVIAGGGSCWNCWTQRYLQHATGLSHRLTLWEHYRAHPLAGPEGYCEPFAWMGAVRICQVIEQIDSGEAVAGRLWQMDMLTRDITSSTVVGVHDCAQCGLHRDPKTRGSADLERRLAYLWPPAETRRPETAAKAHNG